MAISSKLGNVPQFGDQLAAALLRMQQLQDDGGQGKAAFDAGMKTTADVSKAVDDQAARPEELKARIAKAKYTGADYEQKLKAFIESNPTYGQIAGGGNPSPQQPSMLNGFKAKPLNIGGIAGRSSGILGGLGGL